MTSNYHTPIVPGDAADASTVNTPLGALDSQITVNTANIATNTSGLATLNTTITNLSTGVTGQAVKANSLVLPRGADLTIASGVVTVTHSRHRLDTEGAAASDTLDTINGGVDGQILIISQVANARDITIGHNTGNIWTKTAANVVWTVANNTMMLVYNSLLSQWQEI